jgi:hypothetical protein
MRVGMLNDAPSGPRGFYTTSSPEGVTITVGMDRPAESWLVGVRWLAIDVVIGDGAISIEVLPASATDCTRVELSIRIAWDPRPWRESRTREIVASIAPTTGEAELVRRSLIGDRVLARSRIDQMVRDPSIWVRLTLVVEGPRYWLVVDDDVQLAIEDDDWRWPRGGTTGFAVRRVGDGVARAQVRDLEACGVEDAPPHRMPLTMFTEDNRPWQTLVESTLPLPEHVGSVRGRESTLPPREWPTAGAPAVHVVPWDEGIAVWLKPSELGSIPPSPRMQHVTERLRGMLIGRRAWTEPALVTFDELRMRDGTFSIEFRVISGRDPFEIGVCVRADPNHGEFYKGKLIFPTCDASISSLSYPVYAAGDMRVVEGRAPAIPCGWEDWNTLALTVLGPDLWLSLNGTVVVAATDVAKADDFPGDRVAVQFASYADHTDNELAVELRNARVY